MPTEPARDPADQKRPAARALRRPLLWAVLVLVAWWLVGGIGGQFTGKLQEVQKNDNAAFLPASAESTRPGEAVGTGRTLA